MASPFSIYDQLREHDNVRWSLALNSWVMTRYEDVRAMLSGCDMTVDRLTPFYEEFPPKNSQTLRDFKIWADEMAMFIGGARNIGDK